MPDTGNRGQHIKASDSAKRLFANPCWREGVIAQTFYVAAQITCWTFIIQYAMENVAGMTMSKAQNYNIIAMGLFLVSRFICTFLLKYLSPGKAFDATCILGSCVNAIYHLPTKFCRFNLLSRYLRMYVTNVPNDLWNCAERNRR